MAGADGGRKIIVRVLDLNRAELRLQTTSAELVYNVMMHITHGATPVPCLHAQRGHGLVTHSDSAAATIHAEERL